MKTRCQTLPANLRVPSGYAVVGYTTPVTIVVAIGTLYGLVPPPDMVANLFQLGLEVLEVCVLLRVAGSVQIKTERSDIHRVEDCPQFHVLLKVCFKVFRIHFSFPPALGLGP